MKILITGVAGFIGSNLADMLLGHGHEVIGIDNCSYGVFTQVPKGVEFHMMDIRSGEIYSLFENVEVVYHFAAKSCIPECETDPVGTSDICVTGGVNVFEAAKIAGVRKIIYSESSSMYQESEIFPTPETEICPGNFYGAGKAAIRCFTEAYRLSSNLVFTALRYFCVYGPRQDYRRTVPPIMSAFIIKLLKGQSPIIYGNGNKSRDFVYVDDVNDFHLQCLDDSRTDNETFNIGSGIDYSLFNIYELIKKLMDIDIPYISRPDTQKEAYKTLADISKIKELGWIPKVGIQTGLKEMLAYIKDEFKQGNID